MHSLRKLRSISALVLLALLVLTTTTSYNTDDIGEDDDVVTPAPTPKAPWMRRPKSPKPSRAPRPSVTPTSAPAPAPVPVPKPAPAPATTAPAIADDAITAPSPASNATTTRPSGGKCVTGDPWQYISYVDWIWEKCMKPHFNFKNFIFDQLMANNGKLSYCTRWDSPNKLPKATVSKFKVMLQHQYDQWNKWLVGYGCWPFENIELEMVGVPVRDKNLLDWSDDSLCPIYEKVLDGDGIPMCPQECYKHRNFEASSDTSACKGKPFDISLWPTLGQGGGAGGDWGQRVDEANMMSTLDGGSSVIVAHEIGHGFGLPDFMSPATSLVTICPS